MANRVVLDETGLKVSKPGANVLTAGASGLQFSSDWSALGFYRRGEMDCNWNETDYRNFSLGKTFPTPPMVQFHRVLSSSRVELLSAMNSFYWVVDDSYTDINGNFRGGYHMVEGTVTTSQIRIKSWRKGDYEPFRLRYTIFDYGL